MTALLLPTGVTLIWLGDSFLLAGAALCSMLTVTEWTGMRSGPASLPTPLLASGAMTTVLAGSIFWLAPVVILSLASVLAPVFSRHNKRLSTLLVPGYLVLPFVAICWMREVSLVLTLTVVATTVTTDMTAYAAGRMIGGKKIAPVSPEKTWSGALSGLLCACIVAIVIAILFGREVMIWAGFALLISAAAQIGDLLVSLVKRRAGVKDTSQLIPGHGGILDRLDGLMTAVLVGSAGAIVVPDYIA